MPNYASQQEDNLDDDEIERFQSMIATVKASVGQLPAHQRAYLARSYDRETPAGLKDLHRYAIELLKARRTSP
jgi:hypothetical protein